MRCFAATWSQGHFFICSRSWSPRVDQLLRFDESSAIGSHLKLAITSELIGILTKSDPGVAFQRQTRVAMAVVTHVWVHLPAILTTQDGLELLIDRLLCT